MELWLPKTTTAVKPTFNFLSLFHIFEVFTFSKLQFGTPEPEIFPVASNINVLAGREKPRLSMTGTKLQITGFYYSKTVFWEFLATCGV